MEMLQNMTTLLESVAARGNAADVPYIEIAENNLVYALGKELQVSSTWGEQLQSSLSRYEANVSHFAQLRLVVVVVIVVVVVLLLLLFLLIFLILLLFLLFLYKPLPLPFLLFIILLLF